MRIRCKPCTCFIGHSLQAPWAHSVDVETLCLLLTSLFPPQDSNLHISSGAVALARALLFLPFCALVPGNTLSFLLRSHTCDEGSHCMEIPLETADPPMLCHPQPQQFYMHEVTRHILKLKTDLSYTSEMLPTSMNGSLVLALECVASAEIVISMQPAR